MPRVAFPFLVLLSSFAVVACGSSSSSPAGTSSAGAGGASGATSVGGAAGTGGATAGGAAGGGATGGSAGNTTAGGAAGKGAGGTTAGAAGTNAGGAGGMALVPIPTNVDCSKPANCYHLACWDDPQCSSTPDPGGCAVGQVKDIGTTACRACTADDCDGLAGFCCGADVCKTNVACFQYLCKDIEAQCAGVTSATCGFHDLDGDDAYGDCDEAPSDPCCYCKIAVGCGDSPCTPGQLVKNGACASCGPGDCQHPSCRGLNGCGTGCDLGFYFDGVKCRDCSQSGNADYIPACTMGAGGAGGAAGAAGSAGAGG